REVRMHGTTTTEQPCTLRDDPEALLREEEAAALLHFTARALQAWRHAGTGPAFVRVSSRAIRYRRRDLLAWAAARRHPPADPAAGRESSASRAREPLITELEREGANSGPETTR